MAKKNYNAIGKRVVVARKVVPFNGPEKRRISVPNQMFREFIGKMEMDSLPVFARRKMRSIIGLVDLSGDGTVYMTETGFSFYNPLGGISIYLLPDIAVVYLEVIYFSGSKKIKKIFEKRVAKFVELTITNEEIARRQESDFMRNPVSRLMLQSEETEYDMKGNTLIERRTKRTVEVLNHQSPFLKNNIELIYNPEATLQYELKGRVLGLKRH